MRILVLAPQWPDPPKQGAAIRNLHILHHLAQRHSVTLLTFIPADGHWERARIESICEHAEALHHPTRSTRDRLRQLLLSPLPDMAWRLHSPAMQKRVQELCSLESFNAIHIEGIEMAPYALQASKIRNTQYAVRNTQYAIRNTLVYDAHNAEYVLQRRAFTTDLTHPRRWPKAFYSLVQWLRLRRFERLVCRESKRILAVSEADRAALARLSPHSAARIALLPNGVDPAYWSRDADLGRVDMPPNDTLVFDGSMDFRPNVDAALWFAAEVWPLIRAERPQARFYIVGRNPAPAVLALGKTPGVTVTGAVDDPRPWVAGATVYVVPMRMGGGVRLKVLQAMAMGCALVSTPIGAEGIDVRHGHEMLLARSAPDFAGATLSLLANPQRRAALGHTARELAAKKYAWEHLLPTLDEIYP